MTTLIRRALLFACLLMAAATAAQAQDTVTLAIKGVPGRIVQYNLEMGGTLSFVLDGLPVPNSKITGENLAASGAINAYFNTVDAGEDYISYDARMMLDKIMLGGLMQLPDFTGGAGAPEMSMTISPQGSIESIEVKNMNLPGGEILKGGMPGMEDMGMDFSSMDTIMPLVVGLLPPIFPEEPIAVGDKWMQKPSEEDMPLPIFPVIEFKYMLESIDDGVAKIKFKSKGKYDAGFINNFLSMIPEIPMGDDEMTIDNVDLLMTWEIDGTMDFQIAEGLIQDISATGKVELNGAGDLTFNHPNGEATPWEPKLSGTLDMEFGMKYMGDVSREDFDTLFPPAPEEEDEGMDEGETEGCKCECPGESAPEDEGVEDESMEDDTGTEDDSQKSVDDIMDDIDRMEDI